MSKTLDQKLHRLRKKIDQQDKILLRTLSRRTKTVEAIGRLKKKHGMKIIQSGRFKKMLKDRKISAKGLGLDSLFTERILKLIHTEAVRIQKKLHLA